MQSGMIYRKRVTQDVKYLALVTNGGSLIVEEIFDENGVDLVDQIREGDCFVTPSAELDNAKRRFLKTGLDFKNQRDLT